MRVAKRMQLSIEHVFEGIDVAAYEALYFDEDFNEALGHELRLGRKLLRLDRSGAHIVRHIYFEPAHKPGAAVNEAFTSKAGFLEELDYDVHARRGTWRTVPNQWADRVKSTGTIEFAPASSGMRRTVRGEVKFTLFGFGKIVERMIVAEIDKNYTATTAFTRAWLARPR
jgi:uncharacterized protein DUF2505